MTLKTLIRLSLIALAASFSLAAHAQTFSVIHTFTGYGRDGGDPEAGVTLRGGNLYGTISNAYSRNGTVYELINVGDSWIATSLYAFSGSDGSNPLARVVFGPDGHLYGTTYEGGTHGGGTVFELIPSKTTPCKTATCGWIENVIHEFPSSPNDGTEPHHGDLVWDRAGNMYGMTYQSSNDGLIGIIFELQPSGNGWTETIIGGGYFPYGGPALDNNNHLFGTFSGLSYGGILGFTYLEGVGWQSSYEYGFGNDNNGFQPLAGMVADESGNFYGSTSQGGFSNGGGGTIFELSPSGNTWTFTRLYGFARDGYYGCGPEAALTLDAAGNLYGTTACDGAYGVGNVFKLSNTVNGWVYTSLHDFTGGSDGGYPISNVTIDADGTLYGTASDGGDPACRCGTVWMIKP